MTTDLTASLGLLFSGQGTQHPGMLPWLDESPAHPLAARFGAGWRERLADPAWASAGTNAQPLLTTAALAAWRALADELPPPVVVAGYSVGELPAFAVAGVITDGDALRLSLARAEAMDLATAGRPGGLLAVSGPARPRVEAIAASHGLHVAIRLSFDQHLVGGAAGPLARAEADFAAEVARCTLLPIPVPSHTPLMASAARAMEGLLAATPFQRPRCALVCNASGGVLRAPDELRQALAAQVARTIPWDDCLEAVHERGVRCVLEIGPGSALSRTWNARFADVPARSVDEFTTRGAILSWVRARLAR